MAKSLVDDELLALTDPLLPLRKGREFPYPGRKPVPHRAAVTGFANDALGRRTSVVRTGSAFATTAGDHH